MFKVGDVVRLKSGGPDMTVLGSVYQPGLYPVRCTWHSLSEDRYRCGDFPEEALMLSLPVDEFDGWHEAELTELTEEDLHQLHAEGHGH